jgi:NAD(P)-dependent dehydrogenase (short-subunit alcohol dehydrogenase family)
VSVPTPERVPEVAVVTGAGRRLGRLYARGLASRGAAVVVNDVDARVANRVVDEIEAAGGTAMASIASVTERGGAARIVDLAADRFGSVDVVVANAGFTRSAYVEDITPAMWDDVLAVHVTGSFAVSQAAWPMMREQGYGRIVMISSSAGLFGAAASANYAAAKAGVYGLMRALAIEGRPFGINVNAVLPQANPLTDDNAPLDPAEARAWDELNWGTPAVDDYLTPDFLSVVSRRDPALVAPLVLFLTSRDCSVTGEAFAAGMGRFSRVFAAEGPGWYEADGPSTPEGIADHLDAVMDVDHAIVPPDLHVEHTFLSRIDDRSRTGR